ncbi:MAG: molybdenum cofactor guanylyltransferase [Proteobacteria bacterium]|nr:molybdenum cofactor guanylyltransferase [Pseudomonadota bacterium]
MTQSKPLPSVVLGVFVGGRSSRMGGRPKGLLRCPSSAEPIVSRWARIAGVLQLRAAMVGDACAYHGVAPELQRLDDEPSGVGPLGGLRALLRYAGPRSVVAVACDMPFVTPELVARLARATSGGAVIAAREQDGRWQGFFACYRAPLVRPVLDQALACGERSLQGLLARTDTRELELTALEREQLRDWDTPADMARQ